MWSWTRTSKSIDKSQVKKNKKAAKADQGDAEWKRLKSLEFCFLTHKYRFYNEKDLQLAIEQMFIANEIPYEREVRLSK